MIHREPPKAFISYSHDSVAHTDRVLELSDRLRADGVDCVIDQYEPFPARGWMRWMEDQIEAADFVLVICTETYHCRFRGLDRGGTGKGATYEGAIITQELYDAYLENTKFIPCVFDDADRAHAPIILRAYTCFCLDDEAGYERLRRLLTDQHDTPKPELGTPIAQPRRERTQDFLRFRPNTLPPYNAYFTGREAVLEALRDALEKRNTVGLTQPQAISGFGGVGKTETAKAYAYRHREDYAAILWVRAESAETLVPDYAVAARVLGLPEADGQDTMAAVGAMKRWLDKHGNWLLVFDNVDDLEVVRSYWPAQGTGHVLVTSRKPRLDALGVRQPVPLDVMLESEALEFLLERTGREGLEAASAEGRAAAQLVEELGRLPLAIEQAGAYIAVTEASFADYLEAYANAPIDVLEKARVAATDYPETVATTWAMNVSEVERESPASADALRFSAFLAPEEIPEELLVRGAARLGPALAEALGDADDHPLEVGELLEPLARYSLITRNRETRTYNVHRLVQEVVKAAMDDAARRAWEERTLGALDAAYPAPEFENWPMCERLTSHVAAAFESSNRVRTPEAARLLNNAGSYLYHRARYAEAEPLMRRALDIDQQAFGPDHPNVAIRLNNLALLLEDTNRRDEAEPLMRRALEIDEESFGPDHPNVATDLNNLAQLLQATNRRDEAEPLMRRALEIDEESLGPDHPNVARDLNNLAALLEATNRLDEAEPLMRRALAIFEQSLGEDHPKTQAARKNLEGLLGA